VVYPEDQTVAIESKPKKKAVSFALEKNSVRMFVKDPSELLTLEEKQKLVQNIYRYRFQWMG
jgi:hypothetical protein